MLSQIYQFVFISRCDKSVVKQMSQFAEPKSWRYGGDAV